MNRLEKYLEYVKAKHVIKKFKANPKNYDGKVFLARREYCEAVGIVETYKI
jgi:hypothetical protein